MVHCYMHKCSALWQFVDYGANGYACVQVERHGIFAGIIVSLFKGLSRRNGDLGQFVDNYSYGDAVSLGIA